MTHPNRVRLSKLSLGLMVALAAAVNSLDPRDVWARAEALR